MSFDTTLSSLGIATTANSVAQTATTNGSASLGQADFLKLMTAQLQNQDPFDPVDNTQMVAQMAQFSSVAGISEMSTTLKAIQAKLAGASANEATAYIGKTVLAAGDTAFGRTSGGLSGGVELAGDATNVTVTIKNANGEVMKTIDLGQQDAGTIYFDWDGKNGAGEDAGAGPFKVSVDAKSGADSVPAGTLVWAPVQSVSTTSGEIILTLPGIGEVPADQIRQIG
jgi:flagellar basal-body rod modification protein FlgD